MAVGNRGGRPRKPTALKQLAGTYRADRAPRDEPKPSPLAHDAPPITLEREGAELWRDMVDELRRLGLLTSVDRAALAAYCAAFQRIAEARRGMKRTGGPVVKDASGALRMNPWVRIEKAATETLTRIATEFGFTPASRPRLGRRPNDDPPPPAPTSTRSSEDGPTLEGLRGSKPH